MAGQGSGRPDIRLAFFDIDGTLVPFGDFEERHIPADTVAALDALRARGVTVVICTGRPLDLARFVEGDFTFDGYASLNGQYCLLGDELIRAEALGDADLWWLLDRFEDGTFVGSIAQGDRTVHTGRADRLAELPEWWRRFVTITPLEEVDLTVPVYQVTPVEPHLSPDELRYLREHYATFSWNELSCDIVRSGGGKHRGMAAFRERLGVSRAQTIAFGDAANDVRMLAEAGIGVAMGNAIDEVKAAADYVTDAVDAGGVKNALVALGVID